ncbi:MAG: regulatory protein GemA [Desulfovibrio sp.]|uniref:regulatory protein GemA n=1 Tax=Desulfovibrio sp. TaxID=885 RepID=UPI001A7D84DB|nr:regulatory protein GemA [Desulfovibrio sp.]MBD5416977.1 regulatory protein GemA [Desulfovibrio sp.]
MCARVIHFSGPREPQAAPAQAAPKRPPAPRRKRGTVSEEMRKALLAKIHVAKKQLGLTDAEYRAMLEGNFGVSSAAHLDGEGLQRMVFELRAYGFRPKRGHARRGTSRKRTVPATLAKDDTGQGRKKLMQKIEAQLAEKGRVEGTDMPWAYAVSILKKQSGGVTRSLDQATPEQLRGVIAALTRDARRHGRQVY